MCNTSTIAHSSSFESISSFPSSSPCTSKRNHAIKLIGSKSMSNSFGKGERNHHFLDSCSLCKRKLFLGDDIFMYKGDTPFCSEGCRHEQIGIEKWTEKMKYKPIWTSIAKSNEIDDVFVSAAAPVFV